MPARGRPERRQHGALVFPSRLASEGEPRDQFGPRTQQRRRDRAIAAGLRGRRLERRRPNRERRIARREARVLRGRVVGRRAVRHERQSRGIQLGREQLLELVRGRAAGGRTHADHEQRIEADLRGAGRQRDTERHPVLLRGREIDEPLHALIDRERVRRL